MYRVAIIYQILANYREPIFRKLCEQKESVEYTFFSDKENALDTVAVVEPVKATLSIEDGGLRWRFVKNIRLFRHFLWQRGVVKLAFSKEFDTIIYLGNMYYISTWISCFFARLMGKKTLMWSHGFLRDEKGLKGWLRKRFYKLADSMLLYGNRSRDIMIKKGFDPEKLYVVYNSLDYDNQCSIRKNISDTQLTALRKKLFSNPELPILFFIGRLIESKKLDMILAAMDILNKKGIKVNILFIGDGTEKENLTKLAKELNLADSIVFYGACHEEQELAPLIMMSGICVSPGNVGLTAMHAMVYGKPVITSNDYNSQGPEFEVIQPGLTGDFFKADDCDDLAIVISEYIKKKDYFQKQCMRIINDKYNPNYQRHVIRQAVLGVPASEIDIQ